MLLLIELLLLLLLLIAIGTITGGIILYLTKLRGKKLALFITVVIATMVPITPSFLLNCPSLQVAGISVPYPNGYVTIATLVPI